MKTTWNNEKKKLQFEEKLGSPFETFFFKTSLHRQCDLDLTRGFDHFKTTFTPKNLRKCSL